MASEIKGSMAFERGQNTRYFHLMAKARQNKNFINSVIVNDNVVEDPHLIKLEVHNHFQKLFSEEWKVRPFFCPNRNILIDESMRANLTANFSELEIWNAIKGCDGNKAPGPDGFNIASIKKGWDFMKDDILRFMEEFHKNSNLPKGFNASFITLVPKVENPLKLSDYRPISLIGSMYKILSKVLAARLKPTLNSVIGEVQSAFTGGRNIQDSILIANEVVDGWKRNKVKGLIFKLDLEKAFDNLNWVFLFKMMKLFGYPDDWILWIHECLSTASISVLVNGAPTKEFKMQKGVRQGDPLSPFLFIIAAESLNCLFQEAVSLGSLKGLKVSDEDPVLTHLQFADDTLIFCEAKMEEISAVKGLLQGFEVMSGLKINYHKSLVCGVGIDQTHLEMLANAFGCKYQSLPIKYLGMPLGASPKLKSTWKPVIEKFKQRLSSWKRRVLSFGGRLTLIKSVLGSLPIFFLSLFKIPEGVAKEIEGIQARFLWGSDDLKRKIHMVCWSKIKHSKENGGLGVRGIKEMNDALLLKWWWRFGSEKGALWRKIICAKYKMNSNLWLPSMDINRHVSVFWKDIIQIESKKPSVFSKFKDNISLSIGDGKSIRFWTDEWVDGKKLSNLFPGIFRVIINTEESIAEVWQRKEEQFNWEFDFRRNLFIWEAEELESMVNLLNCMQINFQQSPDHFSWKACNSNSYSVSSMYMLSLIPVSNTEISERKTLKWVWHNVAPFRIQCFIWMVHLGKLKTGEHLLRIGVINNHDQALCKFCGRVIESLDHSLLMCQEVWNVWCEILDWWGINWSTPRDLKALFLWWVGTKYKPKIQVIWDCIPHAILWSLWKLRNEHIFQGKTIIWEDLVELIKIRIALWVRSKWDHKEYSVNDFIFRFRSILQAS